MRRLWIAVAGALLLLTAALTLGSPVLCGMVPDWDTCDALPMCGSMYIHSVDGPDWSCESRIFD